MPQTEGKELSIDEMLSKEFKISDEEPEIDEEETPLADEVEEESQAIENNDAEKSDDEEKEEDKEEDLEEPKDDPKKPSKEAKKEFAFQKIRKENADLRASKKQLEETDQYFKELALEQGYTDVEKFKEDLRTSRIIQEATKKGVDPVIYKENADLKDRINKLEKSQQEQELIVKANGFKDAVETAINDYELGKDGKDIIFSRLEENGYTVDTILSLPNPKIVIDGILSDKIQERAKQEHIKELDKLSKVSDEKHEGTPGTGKLSIDDLLKADLDDYKSKIS